jgi:TonB-linked SusC/RagA family outer membrane protein
MRPKFKWIFTLLLAFTMQFSFAQEKTVTGVVSDKTGPLPGANVVVKGSTTSTQADFDGKFAIKAKVGAVLEVSFTGYSNKTVTVGAANTYNVVLSEGVELQEVVVVGYGTTTKERFTGTATKVNIENIEAKTVSNVTQALRGEVAGVSVITGSGAPGSDATIRIRGFGSVNGNRNPLYVVDGAPYTSDVTSINPADIESMTVLKDAAATSIYGSRGANGVILITTKQGKSGKSVVSVDFRTSINTLMLPNYDIIDSPEQYIETAWSSLRTKAMINGEANPAAWASANLYGPSTTDATAEWIDNHYNIWNVPGDQLIDPATGKIAAGVSRKYNPTKWSDAAFGTGYRSETNVQFSGGNDKTRFALSFGYLDDKGYTVNSGYTRYTTRINLENKVNDWLKVSGNIAYTGSKYTNSSSNEGDANSSGNIFAITNTTPAIYDIYLRDDSGNLIADPIFGGYQFDYGNEPYNRRAWTQTNAIADATYDVSQTLGHTLLGNFNIDVDITKALSFETRYSGQYQNYDAANRSNPYYGGWSGDPYGYLSKAVETTINQNFLQLLRYTKSFGSHSFEAFIAHESTDWKDNNFSAAATHSILPNSLDLAQYTTPYGRATSTTQRYTLESYFAQVNYDYAKKYFLTASGRRDGSSRFIHDKWGTFGSIGFGWIVSKEDFMSNLSFVDYLKLKASYGVIGDQGLDLQYGWQKSSINQTAGGEYSFTPSSTKANPGLTWETSKISQVGIETTLFNNRLDINLDYYIKNTDNLFFNQTLPPSSGFNTLQINSGQMRNSGLEFDIAAHLIKENNPGDFKLDLGVNGELLKNEITEMPINPFTGVARVIDGNLSAGHSLYDWYMREWAGVDPANGNALWNLYYNDINDDGVFNVGDEGIDSMVTYLDKNPDANVQRTTTTNYANATQKYVGKSAIPKIRGAFRINAAYKNFDFSAQFSYSVGGYVYDSGYSQLMDSSKLIGANNWHTDILSAWKQPGDVTDVPRLTSGLGTDANYVSTSTRFLTKGDYLSLNNLKIGYTLPQNFISKMKLSKVSMYLSGDNLLIFSKRKGLNPTTLVSTTNTGIYTPMTTFSFGTKVEF